MIETPRTLTALAPAKVNLTLEILGKRPDGYHALDSFFAPVSLFDALTFTPSPTLSLSVEAAPGIAISELGAPEKNLIIRAARLLEQKTGRPLPAAIHLLKRIPLGGGLGGGSSDCAATLHAMNRLFDLGLPPEALLECAAALGSDIPAFVLGGYARMEGRGETVSPVRFSPAPDPLWMVLLNPGVACPTAEIYRACDSALTKPPHLFHNVSLFVQRSDFSGLARCLYNALEPAAFRLYPQVAAAADRLKAAGAAAVLLSGSGATVFGLVENERKGRSVMERLSDSGLWSALVCSLPDGVMAAHGPLTP